MAALHRLHLLLGMAVFLAAVFVWRMISGWGLVTLDATDAPFSKVVSSIQRQAGVKIASNVDPDTKVTLQVRRAPPFEAVDLLAARVDGEMRLGYVLGPNAADVATGVRLAASGQRGEGWRVFSAGWGGGMMLAGDSVPDLRRISLTPTSGDDKSLHAFLDQASQKTGALFAVPSDWNPALTKPPGAGKLGQVAREAAKMAGGKVQEVLLIVTRGQRGERPDGPPRDPASGLGDRQGQRWEGGNRDGRPGGGNRGNMEWAAERVQAQIELLPPEERAQARQDFADMSKFWQEVRALPEEERRAKIEEAMSRPEVQERMEERMAMRDQKRSPQQRAQRYKQYIERKRQALNQPAR